MDDQLAQFDEEMPDVARRRRKHCGNFPSRLPACGVNWLESFGAVWSGGRKNDGGWESMKEGLSASMFRKARDRALKR